MRSAPPATVSDDRTAKERIRDAAVDTIAEAGLSATTARAVAAAAGVSPGLVMHHFGSMDGLRAACDQYVAAVIRQSKGEAMAAGAGFDPLDALRAQTRGPALARYLAQTLVDGSPDVARLVDELVEDAVEYMSAGVETGLIRPSKWPRQRAAILTVWSLGALVLRKHLERLVGVDITDTVDRDPKRATAYIAPVLEVLSEGLITDTTVQIMSEAFVDHQRPTQQETGTA